MYALHVFSLFWSFFTKKRIKRQIEERGGKKTGSIKSDHLPYITELIKKKEEEEEKTQVYEPQP